MEKISSDLKLSELKQNGLNRAYENMNAQWRDLEEHFDLTRKSIESQFEELERRAKEGGLKEQQLDTMQEHLRECERELAAKESKLGSVVEKLRLKEEHLDSTRKSVEECSGDLEFKKQELRSMQISVAKCFSEIESKKNQLGSLEQSLVQCSKKLRWKEQRLEVVEKSIHKCFDEVILKGKELESAEKRLEDCLGKLELKEKELCEVQKLIRERCVELELKERQIDSIKILIQENSEELELKVKQCGETEKSIKDQKMELKLKEKKVESVDKSIKEQLEEVKSREKIMDLRERKIKDLTDEVESEGKKLDSIQEVYKRYCDDVELKEREYNAIGRSIEERKQELELKENQLKSTQNFIEESDKKLKSKEEMLDLIQKKIVECSREKELKEKQLDFLEESIKKCTDSLVSKEKQLNYVQDIAKERLKELEFEEKNLVSFKNSIEECSHDLEMRERQFEKRARELDLKEKQLNTLQNPINEAIKEKELKGKKCNFPSQLKTEQLEYTIANNATVHYPAPFRPCAHGRSLQLLMNESLHRHELVCGQVSTILQTSSNPSKLVLDAMHGFYPPHSREGFMEFDVNIIRRSCILLLEQLMKASPVVNPQVREAAMKLAVEWKQKMRMAHDNCFEVLGFLQLLAAYRLSSCFNGYELQSLLDMVDQHAQALELRQTLGIACKTPVTSILHSRERPEYLPPENAANSSFADLQLTATTYKNFQLLLNEQWNSPDEMCDAIFHSLQMSLDPAKLVLDVIQGSFPRIWEKRETGFQASSMNGYFFMLEQLMRMSPQIDPQVKEEAIKLAVDWKERLIVNTRNSLEVLAFLQLLASYGLASSFDGYEILKLFEVVTQYKQAVELCQTLGFADEIPDFIEKLIERKLYIKAVRFVCAFKLVDNFPPVLLLKEYLENARRSAQKLCQKKKSFQAKDEATDGEIDALRTAMECIIDFNLESEFPPKDIEKRIVELEKLRAERRSSVPGPKKQVWHQNKNKRLRTEVSTVEPFDIPVFTPSGQYETSYLYSGGPRQFASSGNSSRNNLRTRQGFAGNHYLYHS
ncbi:FRIGIDA-like protein 5 [Juglans regia]|uniref:FRIGIDA-like protein 5 n=2 Tax=Juglans regia TaxID=51240 RepID=A0A6P9FA25_JUGRE|nr:FRIGIDA-like protein 5 [Juglans regia]